MIFYSVLSSHWFYVLILSYYSPTIALPHHSKTPIFDTFLQSSGMGDDGKVIGLPVTFQEILLLSWKGSLNAASAAIQLASQPARVNR